MIRWHKTHLPCPWGCGYVFDKGMQRIDPLTNGYTGPSEHGITICSRCRKALSWAGGALTKLDEGELQAEERAMLERLRHLIRGVEVLSGKRY